MATRKKTAKSSTARKRIVSGARKYFLAHGFRNVTMDDIAKELGMSKKTLYAHFNGKVQLVAAAIRNKFDELNGTLEDITPHADEEFAATLRSFLAIVQQHTQEIQPAFLRDIRREAPQLFQLVETLRQSVIQIHFGRIFSAGQRRGLVRRDVPAHLLIELLLATTSAIINPTKLAELKLTPESSFNLVSSVFLEGALTTQGRRKQ